MDKPELRKRLRERRASFLADPAVTAQRLVLTLQICELVVPHFADARVISAYLSDGMEVDPMPVLFRALDAGLDVALPRVTRGDPVLRFHHWLPGDELVPGPLGLMQPRIDAPLIEPDLILAPLLGFDRRLNRLGQGAGFYDRAFATAPNARRIGLAWSVQEVPSLPIDPWDVPLQGIATEREWITA